jgi:transposase
MHGEVQVYRDTEQWLKVRHQVLVESISRKQIARDTGIDIKTVRKMLAHPQPPPYGPRPRVYRKLGPYIDTIQRMLNERGCSPKPMCRSTREVFDHIWERGFSGCYRTVQRYLGEISEEHCSDWETIYDQVRSVDRRRAIKLLMRLSHGSPSGIAASDLDRQPKARDSTAFEWMRKVLQKEISSATLRCELGRVPELGFLLKRLYEGRLADRNRSLSVLASIRGWRTSAICTFLGIDKKTHRKYLRLFHQGGAAALFARQTKTIRRQDDESLRRLLFGILHEPPLNYGVNRTTWTMATLRRVLSEKGQHACPDVIRKITRAAGWRWRKARVVLTSSDANYSEKLSRVRSILSGLQPNGAFFSIDEFGPFTVRMQGGRALTPPGEVRIVPQWQKSRGSLIVTAALELSSNQITHFYSEKKNTAEMIRMMERLIESYPNHQKLYLSWDAASWHISKRLNERIEEHNAAVRRIGGPVVATAPLPSGAQFLNVVESVFSGIARAIIHNSDYSALEDAKAAIDCYFMERNTHFQHHPKRAGRKIWGKERELAMFSEANNCKDPNFYR